jgi:hypothetical protein
VSRRLTLALIAAAGVLSESQNIIADARFPSRDVGVRVTLGRDGHASVSQEYALTGVIGDPTFEFLADSCSEIVRMSAMADDRPVAVAPSEDRRGPWTSLRYTGTSAARAWRISYEVATRGDVAAIPIVMPVSSLETEAGGRGARVSLDVQWTGASGGARVLMPRLVPQSTGSEWSATLLAMPSMIRVSMPAAADAGSCRHSETGNAGGLEWRFSVFVLTMAVWMTAYLAWFGRPWTARS